MKRTMTDCSVIHGCKDPPSRNRCFHAAASETRQRRSGLAPGLQRRKNSSSPSLQLVPLKKAAVAGSEVETAQREMVGGWAEAVEMEAVETEAEMDSAAAGLALHHTIINSCSV